MRQPSRCIKASFFFLLVCSPTGIFFPPVGCFFLSPCKVLAPTAMTPLTSPLNPWSFLPSSLFPFRISAPPSSIRPVSIYFFVPVPILNGPRSVLLVFQSLIHRESARGPWHPSLLLRFPAHLRSLASCRRLVDFLPFPSFTFPLFLNFVPPWPARSDE